MANGKKMVVDIWSDVMCPYCYMGKRMLRGALEQFPHRDEVKILWKSYQLDPGLTTESGIDLYQYLGRKGYDRATINKAHEELKQKGARLGIDFRFERLVLANTFNAHRLMHLANRAGRQDDAHETLFRAHFTDGRNVDDRATLVAIGEELGLDPLEVARVLDSDAFANEVRADMEEAKDLGIEAVPHFMFDREHEVVGAEGSALLLQTLEVAYGEWKAKQKR